MSCRVYLIKNYPTCSGKCFMQFSDPLLWHLSVSELKENSKWAEAFVFSTLFGWEDSGEGTAVWFPICAGVFPPLKSCLRGRRRHKNKSWPCHVWWTFSIKSSLFYTWWICIRIQILWKHMDFVRIYKPAKKKPPLHLHFNRAAPSVPCTSWCLISADSPPLAVGWNAHANTYSNNN